MSLSIPEHYRRAFQDNFDFAIQQERQKLGNRVRVDAFQGKEKVYTDMNEFEFVQRHGRLTDSTPDEVLADNRKLVKVDFKCQKIFDRNDDEFLGSLGRPDSEVLQAMRMAWNRTVDAKIAEAATANAYGGEEPYVTPIALPASQEVAVNFHRTTPANSGLTPQKILRAIQILEENEIDPMEEEVCIAINAKAKMDLTAFVETSPNDVYANMVGDWINGKSPKLMGLTPIMSNRLVRNVSTDVDTVIVWSKARGIVVAPDRLETHIDVLPTKDHAVQISAYGLYGFMRRYEKGVVAIYCDRSPA